MEVRRFKPYLRAMKRMGLSDADMRQVEAEILREPQGHPLIQGLKGVRKARFARPGGGKSGGGRAIYFVSWGNSLLAMLTAYAKNVQDDLTPHDRRAILRIVEELARRK